MRAKEKAARAGWDVGEDRRGGGGGGARGAHAPAAGPAPCSYTFRTHQRSVGAQMWGLPNTTRHSPSERVMGVRDAAPLAYRPLPVPACGLCNTNGEQSRINSLRNGTSSASAPSPTQHPKPARSSVCHMSPKPAHTTVGVPHTDRAITGTGHNSAPVGGETGAGHPFGMPLKCGEGFPCDKTQKPEQLLVPPPPSACPKACALSKPTPRHAKRTPGQATRDSGAKPSPKTPALSHNSCVPIPPPFHRPCAPLHCWRKQGGNVQHSVYPGVHHRMVMPHGAGVDDV